MMLLLATRRPLSFCCAHDLSIPGRQLATVQGSRQIIVQDGNFRAGTARDVRDLCDLYGVTDEAERDRMMTLAVEAKQPAWWQSYDLLYETYVGLEADALTISAFQSSVVHGLLQTAEYARAGHEGAIPRFSPDRIERQTEAKLIRQRILVRDNPPRLAVVLDEAALHRMVGGRVVMAAQLTKILEMWAQPNVVVQVLPFEQGAHPALDTNLTIFELPDPAPDVVYVEGHMGAIYLERPDDLKRSHEVRSACRARFQGSWRLLAAVPGAIVARLYLEPQDRGVLIHSDLGAIKAQVGTRWRRAALVLVPRTINRRAIGMLGGRTGTEQA